VHITIPASRYPWEDVVHEADTAVDDLVRIFQSRLHASPLEGAEARAPKQRSQLAARLRR